MTKAANIAAAGASLSADANGNVTIAGATTASFSSINSGPLAGNRNRIINGAMEIDQRNVGSEINPAVGSTYYLDRWVAISSAASKFKIGRNAGAVAPPAGFINYLGITSLSSYSVGSSEAFGIRQIIEGLNIADLGWGTANAKSITISFWVRSSLTGTFGLGLGNDGFSRAYPASYTISSSNTWEYKTITIPGDTTGTWLTTNGIGMYLTWQIGYGSSLSGTANTWNAGTAFAPTGAVSVVGTNGSTFYLTGVQVESGSIATPFERRLISQELESCKRYLRFHGIGFDWDGNAWTGGAFTCNMRATPIIAATTWSGTISNINTGVGVNGVLLLGNTNSGDQVGWQVTRSAGSRCYGWGVCRLDAEL